MAADETTCGRCGGTVAGHLAFCTHCGSPMASMPPPPQPPPQPPVQHPPTQPAFAPPAYPPLPAYAPPAGYAPQPGAPPPPRRRRTGLVALWVVLALLLVGGGVTAGVLLLDDEPEGARVYDASDRDTPPSEDPSEEPTEEPSASESTIPSASASPVEPSAPPTPVQCWNGSAASLADCTSPTGRAGIEWVFPSMKDADCSPAEADRVQLWNCYDYLDDGAVIRFNYSEWYSFAAAAAHYRNPGYRDGYSENRLDDGRYLWLSYDLGKGQHKAALAYSRAPWSVTVYADTTAHRDAALRELLVMRPREQLRGVR